MLVKMTDEKIKSFFTYQVCLLRSLKLSVTSFIFLGTLLIQLMINVNLLIVKKEAINLENISLLLFFFPVVPAFFIAGTFIIYRIHQKRYAQINESGFKVGEAVYRYEHLIMAETFGPFVMNLRFQDMKDYKFVSLNPARNLEVIKELKLFKKDLYIKKSMLGKN